MRKLYSKQTALSLGAMLLLGYVYAQTNNGLVLVLTILFVGAFLQGVYDLYKQDKT